MEAPRARRDLALLPAVLPAGAATFRTQDPDLVAHLVHAGGTPTRRHPDVEIGPVDDMEGDAACAITLVSVAERVTDASRLARGVHRLQAQHELRSEARLAAQRMRALGYDSPRILHWDNGHAVQLGGHTRPVSGSLARRLPRHAVVVGTRGPVSTMLDEVMREVDSRGVHLGSARAMAKSGVLVIVGDEGVVRIAVGGASRRIASQQSALEGLAGLAPPPLVADRLPALLGAGHHGLASWSVEETIPGVPCGAPPPGPVLVRAVDFLVALHEVGRRAGELGALQDDTEVVGSVCVGSDRARLSRLAMRTSSWLDEIDWGFVHGDFTHANLIIQEGDIRGVVDWETGARAGPPLIDLLHLMVQGHGRRGAKWGHAIIEVLLPWVRDGVPPEVQRYAADVHLDLGPDLLRSLIVAYWLRRLAYQLRTYDDRVKRPVWVENNLVSVLDALDAHD